jgi:hypothetical protein
MVLGLMGILVTDTLTFAEPPATEPVWTDFECLDLSPALGNFCWTINGIKHCVESCSVVDTGYDTLEPNFRLLGDRSMSKSCLSEPGTGILMSFYPRPTDITFSIKRDPVTGNMYTRCWQAAENVGTDTGAVTFQVPGGDDPDDVITWGLQFNAGLAGCEFFGDVVDRILVYGIAEE